MQANILMYEIEIQPDPLYDVKTLVYRYYEYALFNAGNIDPKPTVV